MRPVVPAPSFIIAHAGKTPAMLETRAAHPSPIQPCYSPAKKMARMMALAKESQKVCRLDGVPVEW